MIETWRTGCCFLPPFIGPVAYGEVRTRDPGTNAFDGMTFSADGTAKQGCGDYKKRPGSQKRTFQKVDARDLAGKWCGCACVPCVPAWPCFGILCTTKKALNEDQYMLLFFVFSVVSRFRNAHATIRERPPDECVRFGEHESSCALASRLRLRRQW